MHHCRPERDGRNERRFITRPSQQAQEGGVASGLISELPVGEGGSIHGDVGDDGGVHGDLETGRDSS